MTLQLEASMQGQTAIEQVEHGLPACDISPVIDEEQQYRASAYALLAALLRSAPDQALLDHISVLSELSQDGGDDLSVAMSSMGLSAKMFAPADIDDEYHELFIGLGKGQLVPYGSWYLTGFLMEKPLSDLRDDLARLGFQRNDDVAEPEDHVAALCEVLSLLITDGVDLPAQQHFFQSHMQSWLERFFADLVKARSAVFYKAVGRFGSAFIAFENEYFSMQI